MSYAQLAETRKRAIERVLSVLPPSLSGAISSLGGGKACFSGGLSEIRARAGEISIAVFSGKNLPLRVPLTRKDIEDTLGRICKGTLYMHKETIAQGFVCMEYGVRVGIVGSADSNGNALNSVGEPSALVFRLPCFDCGIGRELKGFIDGGGRIRSALIYSPPAGGKTTAIRSLALACAEDGQRRVVAVDERREFSSEVFNNTSADILFGFKKSFGIEVATRVLNPELIIIDELGSEEEARSVSYAALCGVPVVATVHASEERELRERPAIYELIKKGAFDLLIRLYRQGNEYKFSVKESSEF